MTSAALMAAARAADQAGDAATALRHCDALLAAEPGHAGAGHLAALLAWRQGDAPGAVARLRAVLRQYPQSARGWRDLGYMLRDKALGDAADHAEALACLRRAAELAPGDVDILTLLALALQAAGEDASARAAFDQAMAVPGEDAEALRLRSSTARSLGLLAVAVQQARAFTCAAPRDPQAWRLRAAAQWRAGDHAGALGCIDRALALAPGDAQARYYRGVLLLTLGELRAGFEEYEARWQGALPDLTPRGPPERLLRQGEEIAGRSVFLHWEQGFGDAIQFSRYVPLLLAQGARVTLMVKPALQRLLGGSYAHPALTMMLPAAPPLLDRHALLGSLPQVFGTNAADVPGAPYLRADPVAVAAWRRRLQAAQPAARQRIGLVWSGAAGNEVDAQRSIGLAPLLPWLDMPGVQWVSLQREPRPADAALLPRMPILDATAELQDFADTAALVMALDRVIAVDTAVAHLAGGLGVPLWLLLPFVPDWRWQLHRSDSPWYPAARLFRQPAEGDWPAVVAAVREALQAL